MFPKPKPSYVFLLQNGIADHGLHRDPSPLFSVGASVDSANGHVSSCNSVNRPKDLGMATLNGYPEKRYQELGHGSLPSTPAELRGEADVPSGAGYELLETETRQLIGRFLREFTGLSKAQWSESKELSTMKRVVNDLLAKHRFSFNGMIKKLDLDNKRDMMFVSEVACSLFAEGTTNWGRIASLVAFGAAVSQYLNERGRESCVELVGQEISTYLLSDQRDWLLKNNSWTGFVEFFREPNPETAVRNALIAVAGFAGVGATLALLIR
ncbi:induced myeloid leukemia cell differentiation protein Mcl-1b [Nematolebias whitei]|uniref:induced myeloid leukemia cell differentiation protein Mcl-1b n=1 Tax=Nematolebias whitei TaxID=451745 RepID=UPI0018992030|nr:induced myeloid leukemia cell differentiation protein Mcl-1b [Nematolebias whitei]